MKTIQNLDPHTLWQFNLAIEHGHRNFVDLPMKKIVIFQFVMLTYRRVIPFNPTGIPFVSLIKSHQNPIKHDYPMIF